MLVLEQGRWMQVPFRWFGPDSKYVAKFLKGKNPISPLGDWAEKELNLHFVFEIVYSSKQLMKRNHNQTTEPPNKFPFLSFCLPQMKYLTEAYLLIFFSNNTI